VVANQNPTNVMDDADAGVNCTPSGSGCNFTVTCSGDSDGLSIAISEMFTISSTSASGQLMETLSDPEAGAGLSLTCNYTFTLTPS